MPFALAALKLIPTLVEAGENIAPFVEWAVSVSTSATGPTAADWSNLKAKEDALRAQLRA